MLELKIGCLLSHIFLIFELNLAHILTPAHLAQCNSFIVDLDLLLHFLKECDRLLLVFKLLHHYGHNLHQRQGVYPGK